MKKLKTLLTVAFAVATALVAHAADDVLIASIKTKVHAIGPGVIEGLLKGVDLAEKQYQGLVVWSPEAVRTGKSSEPFGAVRRARPERDQKLATSNPGALASGPSRP
jgi:hypothetical protein